MGTHEENPFDELVSRCIKAFSVTYSDTIALDANGVLGKQRILIMEDERYRRETKMLKAQKTMRDLDEIEALTAEITEEPDPPDDGEEVVEEEEPAVDPFAVDPDYDIRKHGTKKPEAPRGPGRPKTFTADLEKETPTKPKKLFDKARMDMRLKLIQERRAIHNTVKGEEEKEGDALNIFFVPVTREEFEKLGTVEVSVGTSTSKGAFSSDEESEIQKRLGNKKSDGVMEDGGSAYRIEVIDGEEVIVEN